MNPCNKKILLVVSDEQFFLRQLLTTFLTSLGCILTQKNNLEDAGDEFARNNKSLDFVITDRTLVNKDDGQILATFVWDINRYVPCILLTGSRYDLDVEKICTVMTKPFKMDDLAKILRIA